MRFGTAVRDITPPAGLPMGGYAARQGLATGALDPLYCRAAVIEGEGGAAALVALDVVFVSGAWAEPVREHAASYLGCDAARVLIAATHTHSGPDLFRSSVPRADDLRAYEKHLGRIVEGAVEDARAQLRPATLSLGRAEVAGVAASRQVARDDADDMVTVISAASPDGDCLGVIGVFGCHPTVLPATNLGYSRDLFAAAVDTAERHVSAPVLLFNGAAADVSTRFTRREQSRAEMWRLGGLLGEGIARAASAAAPMRSCGVGAKVGQVPVRCRGTLSEEEAQGRAKAAAARLERAQATGLDDGEIRRIQSQAEGALLQLALAQMGGWERLLDRLPEAATLHLMRIGECEILGVPGEMFSKVGQRLCAARPGAAMLVGYANDYLGYLVPSELAGGGDYESLIAMIEPASADAIAEGLAALRLE